MSDELIMIVEDEELIALETRGIVSLWGFNAMTVNSGEEALTVSTRTPPALALMDIKLKGAIDGIETASKLRELYGTAIIFISAYSNMEIIDRAKYAMPFGFLVKPVQERELRASIETALHMYKAETIRKRVEDELRAARDELERRVDDRTRELHESNKALRESEKRYRTLFENARVGIGISSVDGMILACNPAVTNLLGYTHDELLSMNVQDFYYDASDQDRIKMLLRENNFIYDFEAPVRHKNGSLVHVNFFINKIMWNDRDAFHTIMEDITERRQVLDALIRAHDDLERRVVERTAELAGANRLLEAEIIERKRTESSLRMSEERYRTVADFTFDWEYWISPDGRLLYMSPSCERITGYRLSDFIEDPQLMVKIIHPEDAYRIHDHFINACDVLCEEDGLDFRIVRKDGEIRWIGHRCQVVYGSDNRNLGRRGSHRDITDQKRAEEEIVHLNRHIITLQEQERQRVAKDLHDGVSQMMNAAKLNFAAYRQDPEKNQERFDTGMDFIDLASRELREVYSNLYPAVLEDLGIAAAVRLYTKKFLANRGIDAEVTIEEDLVLPIDVQIDLYRIIQESCSNIARHAGANRAWVGLYKQGGSFVLTIGDNGAGFDSGEPKSSEGGFGIITIKQRVKHLGGTFDLETDPAGTRITIIIPEA